MTAHTNHSSNQDFRWIGHAILGSFGHSTSMERLCFENTATWGEKTRLMLSAEMLVFFRMISLSDLPPGKSLKSLKIF
jgi:hypothetical protein